MKLGDISYSLLPESFAGTTVYLFADHFVHQPVGLLQQDTLLYRRMCCGTGHDPPVSVNGKAFYCLSEETAEIENLPADRVAYILSTFGA
ncbi:MAG: hypothetical protein IPJ02_14645 [Chitinophagaceae bacterium]|nr:hypothetical protein [Chitinophagaceae bacterium]